MEPAIIGLGKMGGDMAQQLLKGDQGMVGIDRSPEVTRQLVTMRNEFGGTP
jgi:3-hydroxyisobutyrate dehydrogenase-like beta-hydroxyacid dehydrogenase